MNNIIFRPVSKEVQLTVPSPEPAKNYVPEWLSSMPAFGTKKPSFDKNGKANKTAKMCMPFSDAFMFGYVQETWQDIFIENDGTQFKYFFPTDPEIMSMRGNSSPVPVSSDYINVDMVWRPSWMPSLPKGWSALICHPLNRLDLPFYTYDGVLESDTFSHANPMSNFPFALKKNFAGLIPKGTPMYQIIPFQRNEWRSENLTFDEDLQLSEVSKLRQYFWGGYKKHHWVKKIFS